MRQRGSWPKWGFVRVPPVQSGERVREVSRPTLRATPPSTPPSPGPYPRWPAAHPGGKVASRREDRHETERLNVQRVVHLRTALHVSRLLVHAIKPATGLSPSYTVHCVSVQHQAERRSHLAQKITRDEKCTGEQKRHWTALLRPSNNRMA